MDELKTNEEIKNENENSIGIQDSPESPNEPVIDQPQNQSVESEQISEEKPASEENSEQEATEEKAAETPVEESPVPESTPENPVSSDKKSKKIM